MTRRCEGTSFTFTKAAAAANGLAFGGMWGKHCCMSTELSRLVAEEGVMPALEKCLLWFRQNGYQKELFGKTVDRVGIAILEVAAFSDNILAQKDDILSAKLRTKA